MESHPPYPSPNANPTYHAPLTTAVQALSSLVDHELVKGDIMTLSRLGVAGVRRVLDMLETRSRSDVEGLLGSLEGHSEAVLGSLIDAVANEKNERGRPRSRELLRSPIDNVHASTATAPATLHLGLPTVPTLHRSPSTGTRSVSSRASSSTNITHPSSHTRVEKNKTPAKSTRKQLYCPDCEKSIRNAFDKHFRTHANHLLGLPDDEINEHDAIGCGYCTAQGVVLSDQGKVFHGMKDFLGHIRDVHALTRGRLHWDLTASFNHILSAQPHFRRTIWTMIEQDQQSNGQSTPNNIPTLSWVPSPLNQQLLNKLQVVSGRIDSGTADVDGPTIDALLGQVYQAAAQKWQPLSALSSVSSISQHSTPQVPQQRPAPQTLPQNSFEDFVGIGQVFDTPKYPSDIRSPSILSPSPQTPLPPQHARGAFHPSNEAPLWNQDFVAHHSIHQQPDFPVPTIAFPGHAQFATPPASQSVQNESFDDMCKELGISKADLYNSQ